MKSNLRQALRQRPGTHIENKAQEEPTGVGQDLGINLPPDIIPRMGTLHIETNPKKEIPEPPITIREGPETTQPTEDGQAMILVRIRPATTI